MTVPNLQFKIVKDFYRNKKLFEMWGKARLEIMYENPVDPHYDTAAPSSYGDAVAAYTTRNKLIGFISFHPLPDSDKALWIGTSYVLEKYRKLSVYARMRDNLYVYSREHNFSAVLGSVNVNNKAINRAKLSYGDKPIIQIYKQVIF